MLKKICITGGSVTDIGKTTIAKHLSQYLKTKHQLAVSHFGVEDEKKELDGEDVRVKPGPESMRAMLKKLALVKDGQALIVDVGGEHFADFMDELQKMGNVAENKFDLFVVPVTPEVKPENVVAGLTGLIDHGVAPSKILVVFNRIADENQASQIPRMFASVFEAANVAGFGIHPDPIFKNEMIGIVRGGGTVFERVSDDDIQAAIDNALAEGDDELADKLADALIDSSCATLPANNYNSLFSAVVARASA